MKLEKATIIKLKEYMEENKLVYMPAASLLGFYPYGIKHAELRDIENTPNTRYKVYLEDLKNYCNEDRLFEECPEDHYLGFEIQYIKGVKQLLDYLETGEHTIDLNFKISMDLLKQLKSKLSESKKEKISLVEVPEIEIIIDAYLGNILSSSERLLLRTFYNRDYKLKVTIKDIEEYESISITRHSGDYILPEEMKVVNIFLEAFKEYYNSIDSSLNPAAIEYPIYHRIYDKQMSIKSQLISEIQDTNNLTIVKTDIEYLLRKLDMSGNQYISLYDLKKIRDSKGVVNVFKELSISPEDLNVNRETLLRDIIWSETYGNQINYFITEYFIISKVIFSKLFKKLYITKEDNNFKIKINTESQILESDIFSKLVNDSKVLLLEKALKYIPEFIKIEYQSKSAEELCYIFVKDKIKTEMPAPSGVSVEMHNIILFLYERKSAVDVNIKIQDSQYLEIYMKAIQ